MNEQQALVLPVYAYIHSGMTISTERTGQFTDRWDSGQLGVIYILHDKIIEEWGDLSPESMEKATKCLIAEVEELDCYLTGQVYGYVITRPSETCPHCQHNHGPEEVDSCWGFIGDIEYCREQAMHSVKAIKSHA